MAELSDLELLAELGVDTAPEPVRTLTPLQERIIAGFEDIQRFVKENGRLPQHGEDRDIFERRSEEHTSELQSLMRISYAVFGLQTKNYTQRLTKHNTIIR